MNHNHGEPGDSATVDPKNYWDERYGSGQQWSGRVNTLLADQVIDLPPGRSLDLGCGEGGDVLWLAEKGWYASGIDISSHAIQRAKDAAVDRGIPADRIHLVAADLADWAGDPEKIDGSAEPFDLVTASYLQSPVHLLRSTVLQAAATRVARGGHLVVVSHGDRRPGRPEAFGVESHAQKPRHGADPEGGVEHERGATHEHGVEHERGVEHEHTVEHAHGPGSAPTPESELELLDLDIADWEVVRAETVERMHTRGDGESFVIDDVVVAVRRR